MLTPNGRFAVNALICLGAFSSFHRHEWDTSTPTMRVLEVLLDFFLRADTIAGSDYEATDADRRRLAESSKLYNRSTAVFGEHFAHLLCGASAPPAVTLFTGWGGLAATGEGVPTDDARQLREPDLFVFPPAGFFNFFLFAARIPYAGPEPREIVVHEIEAREGKSALLKDLLLDARPRAIARHQEREKVQKAMQKDIRRGNMKSRR